MANLFKTIELASREITLLSPRRPPCFAGKLKLNIFPVNCSAQVALVIRCEEARMTKLLLIEDQIEDLRAAADVAKSLGFNDVEACNSVHRAMSALENVLSGEAALPDGIVLDLNLGLESGFELLRYWHRTPELSKIPVIIWSIVEGQRGVCELFKVKRFVSKWEGIDALRRALQDLLPSQLAT